MISLIYVFTQVHQIQHIQYRFKKHIIFFTKNIGKVYIQLPLLPKELEIIILKSKNNTLHNQVLHQHDHDFKVRQARIITQLTYLQHNHPTFINIIIDQERIKELPVDDIVLDQIASVEVDNLEAKNFEELADILNDNLDIDGVLDILLLDFEINQLCKDIQNQRNRQRKQRNQDHFLIPTCQSIPLDEFNYLEKLLSTMFPYLFPQDKADFHTLHLRNVKFDEYIDHTLCWHDGRFARHPIFSFIIFNQLQC